MRLQEFCRVLSKKHETKCEAEIISDHEHRFFLVLVIFFLLSGYSYGKIHPSSITTYTMLTLEELILVCVSVGDTLDG